MICKKCGEKLTKEMIDANLCWSCGDIIDENFVEQNEINMKNSNITPSDLSKGDNGIGNKNVIGKCLHIFGLLVLILGTIGSIFLANVGGRYYDFSFSLFALYEFATILSSLILVGFAEIIQLLNKIYNKIA